MFLRMCLVIAVAVCSSSVASAQTVVGPIEFNDSEGFTTGSTAAVTDVSGLITFTGGQQQDFFLGAAYNNGPAAYLFINGGGGFNGAASTGDTGSILFGGGGATTASFHAANLANGPATSFTAIGSDGSTLATLSTQVSTLNGVDPLEILTFNAVGGVNIDRIEVNLPGPASPVNPPYAATIDTFSATIANVPEPSSVVLLSLAACCTVIRRRR